MASWEIDTVSAINAGDMGAARGDIPSTDQRAKRAYAIYTDQHGRAWGSVIENKTGDPCGPLEPQFHAPLRIEDKYITVNSRQRRIVIRYADKIRDINDANTAWDTQMRAYARKEYGDKAGDAMKNPPPGLLDLVGPKPFEKKEPYEAAMTGNKYVLGLSPDKPEWAKEFFPDTPVYVTQKAAELKITNEYPDAEEERAEQHEEETPLLKWAGKAGWRLPNGDVVARDEDETPEEHKARAQAIMEG